MNNLKLKIMKTLDNFSANKLQSQDLAQTKGGCTLTFLYRFWSAVPPGGQGRWHCCHSHALSWMDDCPAGTFHGIVIQASGAWDWSNIPR